MMPTSTQPLKKGWRWKLIGMRIVVNALAIALTAFLVPQIDIINQSFFTYFILAAVFGLLNAFVKPVVTMSKQIIIGLMLAGMIIGSAIATGISSATGDMWSLLPRVAFIGYIFSMLVAGVMVIGLIWQLWSRSEKE